MQRRILGTAAVVSLLCAAVLWCWWRPEMDVQLAFCSRMGAVLAAAWFAYDDVQRLPNWLLLLLPVVLVVMVRWPRFLWLLIPAIVLMAVLRRLFPRAQS